MEASEPKWVNYTLNVIGVNSLRFGGIWLMCGWDSTVDVYENEKLIPFYEATKLMKRPL